MVFQESLIFVNSINNSWFWNKLLFSNSVKETRFKLISFPEVIKTIQGYLSANQPLPILLKILSYVDEIWRELLREFILMQEYIQEECIDMLSDKVDIFK